MKKKVNDENCTNNRKDFCLGHTHYKNARKKTWLTIYVKVKRTLKKFLLGIKLLLYLFRNLLLYFTYKTVCYFHMHYKQNNELHIYLYSFNLIREVLFSFQISSITQLCRSSRICNPELFKKIPIFTIKFLSKAIKMLS